MKPIFLFLPRVDQGTTCTKDRARNKTGDMTYDAPACCIDTARMLQIQEKKNHLVNISWFQTVRMYFLSGKVHIEQNEAAAIQIAFLHTAKTYVKEWHKKS